MPVKVGLERVAEGDQDSMPTRAAVDAIHPRIRKKSWIPSPEYFDIHNGDGL